MGDTTELRTLESIKTHVYMIRGHQVMLDVDLAEIYGYELKAMNQQVKRNIERFPEDFMFQLKKRGNTNGMFKVTICDFKRKWCAKKAQKTSA